MSNRTNGKQSEGTPLAAAATAYAIPASRSITVDEVTRLDDMHNGYKDYLDGRLSFAPLEESEPKKILELGTGSGIWATQAANQFPDAEILAVDAHPLPNRPIPPNMKFRILNIMEPFPFEPETFDIIHARLVFMHIPKPENVIPRVIKLVKPGGWLLLEDLNFNLGDESELGLGPATREWVELYHHTMRSNGVEHVTPNHDQILLASGAFSEVNVKTILFPISEKSGGG
ncbi:S-adenosyl-L-methionine-dependent methyltransferase [Ramaria rubella]|nr:S-adenosyl-L-methionine-dependent methyltransferase [Ramaria rubella]